MRLEGGKEREERRGHSRLCQFTVVAFSLRWDSSWPSSLLEEPFIYWKERKRKTYTHIHNTKQGIIELIFTEFRGLTSKRKGQFYTCLLTCKNFSWIIVLVTLQMFNSHM